MLLKKKITAKTIISERIILLNFLSTALKAIGLRDILKFVSYAKQAF